MGTQNWVIDFTPTLGLKFLKIWLYFSLNEHYMKMCDKTTYPFQEEVVYLGRSFFIQNKPDMQSGYKQFLSFRY